MTRGSLMAQMIKKGPTMQQTWVRLLGWKDTLENGMATHSSLENSMNRGAWWATYSPWDHEELYMTERLIHTHTLTS